MSMDPLDEDNMELANEEWELEPEPEPEAHDWEPTSDSEEPEPGSPGGAPSADEPPPPTPVKEEAPAMAPVPEDYSPDGGEMDEYEESWDRFSEPPSEPTSRMPPAGGADGPSESEDERGGVREPLQFILEAADDEGTAAPPEPAPDYDAAATALQSAYRGKASRAATGSLKAGDDDDDGDEAQFELEPNSITPSVAAPSTAPEAAAAAADDDQPLVDESDFELIRPPKFEVDSAMGAHLKAAEREALKTRITRLPVAPVPPAKYGADAVADERAKAFQQDLPALRAQLRALGPMGQQLQQLAIKHAASARRTHKHTPHNQRAAVPEADWWNCLLESLGLPDLAALVDALAVPGPGGRGAAVRV